MSSTATLSSIAGSTVTFNLFMASQVHYHYATISLHCGCDKLVKWKIDILTSMQNYGTSQLTYGGKLNWWGKIICLLAKPEKWSSLNLQHVIPFFFFFCSKKWQLIRCGTVANTIVYTESMHVHPMQQICGKVWMS